MPNMYDRTRMEKQILAIGVVRDGDRILMRKKPEGSPPYAQTWYLFGAYVNPEDDFEQALAETIKSQAGVDVRVAEKIGEDEEIKPNNEGIETNFVYFDYLCEYLGGELVPGEGIEKLEWASVGDLENYDLVPPSEKLFKKLGYLSDGK